MEEMNRSAGRYVGSETKIVIEPGAQPKSIGYQIALVIK